VSELEEAFATANGLRLHYVRTGGDKPAMLLAHGFSDNASCWASTIRVLARDFDVIAYDARGHGETEAAKSGYSGEDQADDLLGLVDALGLERPVLMGHSMGGDTVGWAAVKAPDRVRAAILEDSGIPSPKATGFGPEQRQKLREGLASWVRSLQSKTVEELVAQVAANDPRWPEEDRLPWARSKLQLSANAIDGFATAERRDLCERYPEIRCPVLLLKADADDEERARHREVVSRIPRGEIVHVDAAGHNVRRDEPARAMYQLGRFLARV
jgi:pimeloyl-ACP methyl ester carboxylesterase